MQRYSPDAISNHLAPNTHTGFVQVGLAGSGLVAFGFVMGFVAVVPGATQGARGARSGGAIGVANHSASAPSATITNNYLATTTRGAATQAGEIASNTTGGEADHHHTTARESGNQTTACAGD